MESSSTGAKKINHKKTGEIFLQTHLSLALDGGPELAELREVDALVAVLCLVNGQDDGLGRASDVLPCLPGESGPWPRPQSFSLQPKYRNERHL